MSTAALNNLWTYIESMSLSNRSKQWLADKLIESKTPKKETQAQYVRESLQRAWSEVKEAQRTGKELQSARDLLAEIDTW